MRGGGGVRGAERSVGLGVVRRYCKALGGGWGVGLVGMWWEKFSDETELVW